MVASTQNYADLSCCHEPLDRRGDYSSVRVLFDLTTSFNANVLEYLSATLFPDRKFNNDSINEIFDQFSPTPRVCLNYQQHPDELEAYKKDVTMAIMATNLSNIEGLFRVAKSLRMDASSHKICLVRRAQEDDVGSHPVVTVITPTVQSRLAMKFRDLQQDEMVRHYQRFARVPDSRHVAGVLFEAFAQRKLQKGLVISPFPMVKLKKARDGALPQYYSSHVALDDLNLERFRREALKRVYNVEIKPVRVEVFPDEGPRIIEEGIFYVPAATNHEALNPFILLDDVLYIFHFTVGSTHGIKFGLISFFEKYQEQKHIPPISSWRFIFIIDSNQTLICPQPRRLKLRELPLHTAVIEVALHSSQA